MKKPVIFVLLLALFFTIPISVKANSGEIRFTTAHNQVERGDTFTVVCQVTSTEPYLDAEFFIQYNSQVLQFVEGGNKVSGGNGTLSVSSVGNTTETNKKTFSLQFKALKKGASTISVNGGATVTDGEGTSFSVSSNRITIEVVKSSAQKENEITTTPEPIVTPEPVFNKNAKLASLETTALSFAPTFDSKTTEYEATVDCNTEILYVSYQTANEKAGVQISGNENLQIGENKVTVTVTAENGNKKEYHILVNKETQTETEERELAEKGEVKDISFKIGKDNNRVIIKNSYEFEVLEISEEVNIPAGYIESSIILDGISLPAFTMENDLDNNYLLLYLRGPSGESNYYQYDRSEQTLQRYTGKMIEKINRSATETKEAPISFTSQHVLLGIIVGLVILILCMAIAMLKMAIKKREGKKERDELSDLDF